MTTQRKRYRAAVKARMAFEAVTGEQPINELASAHGGHPTPSVQGTRSVQTAGPRLLTARAGKQAPADEALQAPVDQPIGPRKVEVDGLNTHAGLAR
jgi:transposase-like protein